MLPGHAEYQAFLRPESSERPAGVEPALPPRQGGRLPLHHGRIQIVKDLQSTGRDSNPRHRITGAVSLPLDDQCYLVNDEVRMTNDENYVPSFRHSSFVIRHFPSGTGGYRTHIVRFKKPVHYLVCHSPVTVGAEGVEPSTWTL